MRVTLFAIAVFVVVGCSRRNPTQVDITLNNSEPTPNLVVPEPPKSLLHLDFVKLWEQTGPQWLSPEEEERLFYGRVIYSDHSDECFAVQMVGSGLAGSFVILARNDAQREVLRRVRATAQVPPKRQPSGWHASGEFGGKRITVIAVPQTLADIRGRFHDLAVHQMAPILAMNGSAGSHRAVPGSILRWNFPFTTPDCTGTITLALVPAGDQTSLEQLIPPSDVVGRSLLGSRREEENLILAIVEEKKLIP